MIEIFRNGELGTMPTAGYGRGTAIFYTGTKRSIVLSMITRLLWQGKAFIGRGVIRNRWFGFNIIKGRCYVGEGWLDGKPALILDYEGMSRVFRIVRDELRFISPGLLLGRVYLKTSPPRYFCHSRWI